ncbi:hypothetical protein HanIR_Chr15g0776061 [Helianthus annuus]|nr:hypothetical protein HanIR_Chr15g0776061 [Helianthus annuus]
MLPINLIGSVDLLPMNFIFNLITKTRSHCIIILKASILSRKSDRLPHILIRSYRYYQIVLPQTLFQNQPIISLKKKLFSMNTKFIAKLLLITNVFTRTFKFQILYLIARSFEIKRTYYELLYTT